LVTLITNWDVRVCMCVCIHVFCLIFSPTWNLMKIILFLFRPLLRSPSPSFLIFLYTQNVGENCWVPISKYIIHYRPKSHKSFGNLSRTYRTIHSDIAAMTQPVGRTDTQKCDESHCKNNNFIHQLTSTSRHNPIFVLCICINIYLYFPS
jgi:hypothetical protein